MENVKSIGLRLFPIFIAVFFGFGFLYFNSSVADASNSSHKYDMTTSAAELVARVHELNVGWDWVPKCGDGAHWNIRESYCKGGNGESDFSRERQRGYGIMNEGELIAKAKELNVGWDWEPRCANSAHWNWRNLHCEGGDN